ncbi:MAG: hypothetical protein RL262_1173, partial [Bacteroidota bacterium]
DDEEEEEEEEDLSQKMKQNKKNKLIKPSQNLYKVEEAGYYAFSGRNQQQGDLSLVIEVLKHSESEGIIKELNDKVDDENFEELGDEDLPVELVVNKNSANTPHTYKAVDGKENIQALVKELLLQKSCLQKSIRRRAPLPIFLLQMKRRLKKHWHYLNPYLKTKTLFGLDKT